MPGPSLLQLLQEQGMLKLDRCIDPETVQEVARSFFALLASKHPQNNTVTRSPHWHLVRHTRQSRRCCSRSNDWELTVVTRSDFEVLDLTVVAPALDQIVVALHSTLARFLGEEQVHLHSVGIVTSFPNCKPQVIHRYPLPPTLLQRCSQGRTSQTVAICCLRVRPVGTAATTLSRRLMNESLLQHDVTAEMGPTAYW